MFRVAGAMVERLDGITAQGRPACADNGLDDRFRSDMVERAALEHPRSN